jgi:hypothetical protein
LERRVRIAEARSDAKADEVSDGRGSEV